jgi:putative radical SAM enzyme (TIGR03279 family)
MHTQIVLCPGINDGEALEKTVRDLYAFRARIVSLAVVPVGLTDHRFGLSPLRKIDSAYAKDLVKKVETWQTGFRREIGRGFIYASDEFHILAGRTIPPAKAYDGFPQVENGVGIVRSFLTDFAKQSVRLPRRLSSRRTLTMATGELAQGFIRDSVLPRLRKIQGLTVHLEIVPNALFGRSVTVAGLLSGKCLYSALKGKMCGDLLLLPPDVLNADGLFLDDSTVPQLEAQLHVPVLVFDGNWRDVFRRLENSIEGVTPPKVDTKTVPSTRHPVPLP